MNFVSFRRRIHSQLGEDKNGSLPNSYLNKFFFNTALFSVLLSIILTENSIDKTVFNFLLLLDEIVGIIFITEYILKVWISPISGNYGKGGKAILKFIISPKAIIDLLTIVPFVFEIAGHSNFLILRILRILRFFRLNNSSPFKEGEKIIKTILKNKFSELRVTFIYTVSLIFGSSVLLYLVERDVQPDAFGSIPRVIWWSICTVTTVGYGDLYPISPLGKFIAGITALLGIFIIAIPTAILVSGYDEAILNKKNKIK